MAVHKSILDTRTAAVNGRKMKRKNHEAATKEFIKNRVKVEDECWIWQLSCMSNGYGAIWHCGKVQTAQRVVWDLWNGPIPDGLHVCHVCDNRKCVNPAHLFLGTNHENRLDSVSKGRHKFPVFTGTDHPNSKLSWHDVECIRRSSFTTKLAAQFGVSKTTIRRVRNRTTYKFEQR